MAEEGLAGQVAETWQIHARIVLYLLEAIPEEALGDAAAKRGRTVAAALAHLHNTRLMWLKAAAPERLEGLAKFESGDTPGKEALVGALQQSAEAVRAMVEAAVASGGRIKSFKPHAAAFVGYLISHEAFHMGKIDLILGQCGHPLPDKAHYGLWEWGVR